MTSFDRLPPEISEYIKIVESDSPRSCPEQKALAAHVRNCFENEDLNVDTELLSKYIGLAKYFPFKELLPWEKFITALWNCTFTTDGYPRWTIIFAMIGRGAGKDGYIAYDGMCSISPFNKIKNYNVDICANNEDQAVRPIEDLVNALETPKTEKKLNKFFYHTKEKVQGRTNRGVMRGHTNNPKGRDGLRSGKIIFNEVHQYENYDNIKVFTTGLGKVEHPRRGIFSSNGDVNDGPLDDYLARSMRILFEDEPDDGFLPFICRLESVDQVHDPLNWYMANPSLAYFPSLYKETADEYKDWRDHPEQNGDFLTKRMGIRAGIKEISVTDYEKVLKTKKDLPDLVGWSCTVGVDYAEINDWASVNLHFRRGNDRFDISHSWLCLKSRNLSRIKAPWQAWADSGHITVVDDVSISPDLIAEYIRDAGMRYNIKMLAMDNFRWALVSESFKRIGFDANDKSRVKLVRPSDIMTVDPVIQECFDRDYFNWGDCPPLRWAVSNTKRVLSSKRIGVATGNFIYAKVEPKSRKTDPWMALVASMVVECSLGTGVAPTLPPVGAIIIQ